jgi:hypothetical protein
MPVTVLVGRVGAKLLRPSGFLSWLLFRFLLLPLEWSQRLSEPIGMKWAGAGMEKAIRRAYIAHGRRS